MKSQKLNPVFSKSKHFAFVSIITLICALAYVGSDIYAPSLPYIAKDFETTVTLAKLTMSIYLLTMGVFQVFAGILSDKMGRLKLLKLSVGLFILGSLGCFLAPNIEVLLFFRFVQALGASAGTVTGQAIIVDLYDKGKTAQFFSIILPLVALSPAIAPIIGGYLQDYAHWRASFAVLMGYGLAIFVLMALPIIPRVPPISRPFSAAEHLIHHASEEHVRLFPQMKVMAKNAHFMGHTVFTMGAFATYFCFIVIIPFVFESHGFSALAVGYAFSVEAIVYMVASFVARAWSKRFSHDQLVFIGLVFIAVGTISVTIDLFLPYTHVVFFLIPFYIVTIGNGFVMPFATASAMSFYPKKSGFVSGLLSSGQLGAAGLTTALIALAGSEYNLLSICLIALTVSFGSLFYYFRFMRLEK